MCGQIYAFSRKTLFLPGQEPGGDKSRVFSDKGSAYRSRLAGSAKSNAVCA